MASHRRRTGIRVEPATSWLATFSLMKLLIAPLERPISRSITAMHQRPHITLGERQLRPPGGLRAEGEFLNGLDSQFGRIGGRIDPVPFL